MKQLRKDYGIPSSKVDRAAPTLSQRDTPLDVLRGFDQFWRIGAEDIFHGLAKATVSPFWTSVSTQFTHPSWDGFHIYDLIFPVVFIPGRSRDTLFSWPRSLKMEKRKNNFFGRSSKWSYPCVIRAHL